LPLKVPQTRDGQFYPQSLERGLRSERALERALLLAIAEMYVQGVSTRRVKRIVEELCGLEVSSSQVLGDELFGLRGRSRSWRYVHPAPG
jgi:transposase-like protein